MSEELGLKGKKFKGKLGHPKTPPKLTKLRFKASSPSGVDAWSTPTRSKKPIRILEYSFRSLVTAGNNPAATDDDNDNVEAAGAAGNTNTSAGMGTDFGVDYDCTGETIEVVAGDAGLTLISSPPALTPPSSPPKRGKLDNKLAMDGGADVAGALLGDGSATSPLSEGSEGGPDKSSSSSSSSSSSRKSPKPSYWETPSKMSPGARGLRKKLLSISGKKKDKSGEDEDKSRGTSTVGTGTVGTEEDEDKVCYFSGQSIKKGGPYYYANHIPSASAGEDKDNQSLQLCTMPSSMKLMGCPTICDDDIRRLDKFYFAKSNRHLPEDLQLSSNWTRVAKYCSFSGRAIPDGVPFYYARLKAVDENDRSILGRFCYLRADVVSANDNGGEEDETDKGANKNFPRPLGPQDLTYLLTNYPEVCGLLPSDILEDPAEWSLIDKFCFFSGGPIKADDTYYEANLDGKNIYLLVVLTPAVTARELFRLTMKRPQGRGLQLLEQIRKDLIPLNVREVEAMDRLYDLSFEDFDSLRERHYGSYLELPRRLINPLRWERVVPPSFSAAKEEAMERAVAYDTKYMSNSSPSEQKASGEKQSETSPTEEHCFADDLNHLIYKAKQGVQTLTCGAPESFTLKDLMQDDESFLRELAKEDRINSGSNDDESFDTASFDNLKATIQRYSSRVGGQSVISFDTRFIAADRSSFDEFSYADEASFYTAATETTAEPSAWKNKNYQPDLGTLVE